MRQRPARITFLPAAFASVILIFPLIAQPTPSPYPAAAPGFPSATAAASLSGVQATADSRVDTIEVRDADAALRRTISRTELSALLPWMTFNTDADGPCALSLSDSGRLLFIAVCDSNAATDGQPGDAILRYDTYTDQLSVFLRAELGGFNLLPRPTIQHFRGRLYLGQTGQIAVYQARMNDATASLLFTAPVGVTTATTAVCIDRLTSTLYAANSSTLKRAPIVGNSLVMTTVGTLSSPVRALAWSDQYGGLGQGGLYWAYTYSAGGPPDSPLVGYITPPMARGTATLASAIYLRGDATLLAPTGLSAVSDGSLLLSTVTQSLRVRDNSDTRLTFSQWQADEFSQVVRFAKGLISPDGEPAGWVIDADVIPSWSRFHPATPDAAAWVVLLLLMSDHVNGDPQAQALVRTILTRYAGLAPDQIAPVSSADGIFRHWINPSDGQVKPGWDPEFATLSTMKIVLAAARARAYYPTDSSIRIAANSIICNVRNWDSYFDSSRRTYFKGLQAGGRDPASISSGWHESVIFAEQAGVYGFTTGPQNAAAWLNRPMWPSASLVSNRRVTSNSGSGFLPAFISLYPQLTMAQYRADPAWQEHITNLALNHAAWNDDAGPKYYTVFSAGTTKSEWGGYHADSLTNHPGDVTTFTSLLAMAASTSPIRADGGPINAAAAAYHAYRSGARQTFKSGASILYRRSQVDPAYSPNSAGLPDVALGALGLAELLRPMSVSTVLTGQYPSCEGNLGCPSDWNEDGGVDGSDVDAFFADWVLGNADITEDGGTDGTDVEQFFVLWQAGC